MPINFQDDCLPALIALSEFEPGLAGWGSDRFTIRKWLKDNLNQDDATAREVIRLLYSDGLVEPHDNSSPDSPNYLASVKITPDGMRELGLWPTGQDAAARLILATIAALDQLEHQEADPKASRLFDTAKETLTDIVNGASGSMLAQLIVQAAGLP